MKWAVAAFVWFALMLAGSTVFICTVGHHGWHWAPACIAISASGTIYFAAKLMASED